MSNGKRESGLHVLGQTAPPNIEADDSPNPEVVGAVVDYLIGTALAKYLEDHPNTVREIDMLMVGHYVHLRIAHNLAQRWDQRNPGSLNNTMKAIDLTFRQAIRGLKK